MNPPLSSDASRPRLQRLAAVLLLVLAVLASSAVLRAQSASLTTLAPFFFTSDGLVPIRPLVEGGDGNFYGTTFRGGQANDGTIFKVTPTGDFTPLYDFANDPSGNASPLAGLLAATDGNFYGTTATGSFFQLTPTGVLTTLYTFDDTVAGAPQCALTEGTDGAFYGVSFGGGTANDGAVFKLTAAGAFTLLHTFTGSDGQYPINSLVQGTDGNFYGTTIAGGGSNAGTIFSITPGGVFTLLHEFDNTDGGSPECRLVQASDGNFYGTASYGGASGDGTVFEMTPAGALTTIYTFTNGPADGGRPYGGVTLGTNGNLYGITRNGGANGDGTIFEMTLGGTLLFVYSFTAPSSQQNSDGTHSEAYLVLGSDGNFYGVNQLGGDNRQGSIFSITPTGAYTTLHSFTTDGSAHCLARLTPDGLGHFYGTTRDGGSSENGSIFEYEPGINLFTIHNFSGTDGTYSFSRLVLAGDGNFYGTTYLGGAYGEGTIFRLTLSGSLTTLYSFSAVDSNGFNADGARPACGLTQGADGSLYGVTAGGGANNAGEFFKITTAGAFTSLHSFTAAEGEHPQVALLAGADGNFYGTGAQGGANGSGTVFSLTPAGSLTVLHNFGATDANGANTDGADPRGSLAQGADGTFYGATAGGGTNATGTIFSLTSAGVHTVLHAFGAVDANGFNADGTYPIAALLPGSDGNLYGATAGGGTGGNGTLFVITPGGRLTTLHDFSASGTGGQNTDGESPFADLLEVADGTFYGTAPYGGPFGVGTIFSLTVSPAVISSTTATATVGQPFAYEIAGTNTPASYTANPLPPGLTESTYNPGATGDRISGTPTTAGTYAITLSATNAGGTGTSTLNLTVNPAATPTPTPTPSPSPSPTATPSPSPTASPTATPTASPTPGVQPTVVITSPPDGITVTVGEDLPLAASVTDPAGLLAQVRFAVGSALVDTAPATAAPFVFDTVAPTAPGQYAIQVTVVDTLGRASTASVNVNVIATTDTALPTAGLLTPISGRNLAAGSTVTLSFTAATASTTALDHVSLYADGTVVATFDASGNVVSAKGATPTRRDAGPLANLFQTPYTLPGADKLVNLIAVAVDKLGQSAVSKVASVHARVTSDKAPVVALGSFANGGTHLRVGSTNTVSVSASDPDAGTTNTNTAASTGPRRADASSDATLALLEYYLNGTKIGEATTPPFRFTFTPPASGKYVLHAVATDGSGLAAVSEPAVVEADPAPTVNLAIGGSGAAVEGGANGIVVVTRTGDTSQPLTVSYKAKGAAVAGVDYKKLPGSVTIPAGAVKAKIKVKPINGSPNASILKIKVQLLPSVDGSYVIGTSPVKLKLIGD